MGGSKGVSKKVLKEEAILVLRFTSFFSYKNRN